MAGAYREVVASSERVTLAHEPSFTLGRAQVEPSTRLLEVDGRTEVIEPRMMQVLVALWRANGHVVTRDELIELCWEGRAVGEDAVSRVLWRLRQLLVRLGPCGFVIETIPRVGYRVVADAGQAPADVGASSGEPVLRRGLSRRSLGAGAIAAAGIAIAGGLGWASGHRRHQPAERAKRFYDQAMELTGEGGFAQSQQVLAYLREAVRIDPDYAEAWGALALQYSNQLDWNAPRRDATQLKIAGRSAARRALQLDADNVEASAALLSMDSPYGRWLEVERGLHALLARGGDHNPAEVRLGRLLIETGQFTAAMGIFASLASRYPSWPYVRWRVADVLLMLGRLQEAEEEIQTGLRLWPRHVMYWISKIRLLLLAGDTAEALRFARDQSAQPLDNDSVVNREILLTQAMVDQSAASIQRARDDLLRLARTGELAIPAMEFAFMREVDLAFDLYTGYFLDRGPWRTGPAERRYTGGLFEVETEQLRKDPRFMTIVREIGLERYWRDAGVKPDFMRA